MPSTRTITTAEQLLAAGDIGRCELVRGELRMMSPSSYRHGRVTAAMAHILRQHALDHGLGDVLGAETGFIIARNPDTVRAPDVAFVRADRLDLAPERGFFPGPPDLAVEVLSPDDTAGEVLAKVGDWLEAGTREVWIADPQRRTLTVHRPDAPQATYSAGESCEAGDLLPGLHLAIRDVFA